jgi:cyclophilin family peptidyl-prolyl cis-trans isomerase
MTQPRATIRHPAQPRRALLAAVAVTAALLLGPAPARAAVPDIDPAVRKVRIETSQGSFVILLERDRAPLTTLNFLNYVKIGYYNGTIFHRVISNFVIQGGGYDEKFAAKEVGGPVPNESGNGLSNKRGTVGLARGELPHSGNAQFYVNLTDNDELDPTPLRWGYAVFGRIIEGMDVVDRIGRTPTGPVGPWPKDAPLESVVIKHAEMISDGAAASPAGAPAPAAPPPGKPPAK